jgi:Reverse transcriptase (RNA-dependent DNA polymerase)/Retroviral aspartyl protease
MAFTVNCKLVHNGISIATLGLADSGAGGYVFIRRQFAIRLSKRIGVSIEKPGDSLKLYGYDGRESDEIQEVVICTLDVQGHRILNTPMVVIDMHHDIILGREWFARQDVLIDCKRRKLIWPDQRRDYVPAHELPLAREALTDDKLDPRYQEDADRRDRVMEERPPRPKHILRRPLKGKQTYDLHCRESLWQMDRELSLGEETPNLPASRGKSPCIKSKPRQVDIALISGAGFHVGIKRKENEFFISSLYEINRIIDEKGNNAKAADETEEETLKRTVPKEYHDLIRVFSKAESDKLPPHRPYDHKIKLTGDVPLGYHPLYHQTIEELQTLKEYLRDNLDKGFIEHSSAPFASPILFVKKPSGALRFCIDYRKLNEITEKDRYPLPLLDETLARISRSKVFTKLDIRQAFHRIRMDPASEELTTFRTRYGQYKCKVMPFGLTNGPATYQRYMNDVLFEYLDDFYTAYLDNIIIYLEDAVEYKVYIYKVLKKLRDTSL